MQDCVLDVTEHQPDVLSADGCGEVVVQRLLQLLTSLVPEALHQEALHVRQATGVPRELWKVVPDGDTCHLLGQQVRLV